MGSYKKLALVLVIALLVIIVASFALNYYRSIEGEIIVFSQLVQVTVNGLNEKVVSIKLPEPFTVEWKTVDELAHAKCYLTGYDGLGNNSRGVSSVGSFTVSGLLEGSYYYTLSCDSGGKKYFDFIEVNIGQ